MSTVGTGQDEATRDAIARGDAVDDVKGQVVEQRATERRRSLHAVEAVVLEAAEGFQTSLAATTIKRSGVNATDISGGFQAWRAAGVPVRAETRRRLTTSICKLMLTVSADLPT
jgi:rhodanese-related sulfurtransferase